MRALIIVFAASICMTSCGSARHSASTETRDSLRIEVRTERVERRDTVYIEIPRQVEKIVSRDTASHLENDYAASDASIDASGFLHHSLSTRPRRMAASVTTTHERRDSIIYRDREVQVEKPYPVERRLTSWQQARLRSWWLLAAVIAGYALWKCRRFIFQMSRR